MYNPWPTAGMPIRALLLFLIDLKAIDLPAAERAFGSWRRTK